MVPCAFVPFAKLHYKYENKRLIKCAPYWKKIAVPLQEQNSVGCGGQAYPELISAQLI